MPSPQTLTINFNQEETDLIWNFVQENYPNLTGAQITNYLQKVAKQGIATYIIGKTTQQAKNKQDQASAEMVATIEALKSVMPIDPGLIE